MKQITKLSDISINKRSKVYILFPHPDDETYFTAGIMQKLHKENIYTKVIIFSKGEASTLKKTKAAKRNLPLARKKELKNALLRLCVTNFVQLSFKDSDFINESQRIDIYINKLFHQQKPTHVITFEPDGVYGHADHILLSKIVNRNIDKKKTRLIYATVSPSFVIPKQLKKMSNKKIKPTIPNYYYKLSFKESLNKLLALFEHKSQFGSILNPKNFLKRVISESLQKEYFTILN